MGGWVGERVIEVGVPGGDALVPCLQLYGHLLELLGGGTSNETTNGP